MEDNEFETTLKKLSDRVSQFRSTTVKSRESILKFGFLSKVNIKSPLVYYGAVPLIVAILLFFWKPGFVMEEVSIDGNFSEKKLSFKKLLGSTILFTSIITIIIFIYFYREKQSEVAPTISF